MRELTENESNECFYLVDWDGVVELWRRNCANYRKGLYFIGCRIKLAFTQTRNRRGFTPKSLGNLSRACF